MGIRCDRRHGSHVEHVCLPLTALAWANEPLCSDHSSVSRSGRVDFITAELVGAAVAELSGAGRGVVGDHRRLLQRATGLQVGRDAGGPERVIADPGGLLPPAPALDHRVSVGLGQGAFGSTSSCPGESCGTIAPADRSPGPVTSLTGTVTVLRGEQRSRGAYCSSFRRKVRVRSCPRRDYGTPLSQRAFV